MKVFPKLRRALNRRPLSTQHFKTLESTIESAQRCVELERWEDCSWHSRKSRARRKSHLCKQDLGFTFCHNPMKKSRGE